MDELPVCRILPGVGRAEPGPLLVCEADIDIAAVGGDEVSFSRSETLMQGASRCTFRYKFNSPWPRRQAKRKWPKSRQSIRPIGKDWASRFCID